MKVLSDLIACSDEIVSSVWIIVYFVVLSSANLLEDNIILDYYKIFQLA